MASKARRKIAKGLKLAEVVEVKEPTSTCLVCNHGITTSKNATGDLVEAFEGFHLADVVIEASKSFSFAAFESPLWAEKAKKAALDFERPLYLAFIKAIPNRVEVKEAALPDGLEVIKEFISERDEETLLNSIVFDEKAQTLKVNTGWYYLSFNNETPCTYLQHRQVQHYNHDFVYGENKIDFERFNGRTFPDSWRKILLSRFDVGFDQCTANRYESGSGIPPHVDSHDCCTDTIYSVSLGADVTMNFCKGDLKVNVDLPRRSLLKMSADSRYFWTHGIQPRHSDVIRTDQGRLMTRPRTVRTSLTFRKALRGGLCECGRCEDRKPIGEEVAVELEQSRVHDVYEEIADHFSHTRHTQWPKVAEFIDRVLPEHAILVDVGCGNGKYLQDRKRNSFRVGCDRSANLLSICADRGFNAVRADCLQLPWRDNSADGVISIAVIHHLATESRRVKAVAEMNRVLRKGAKCLIYAWAKDQKSSVYLKENAECTKNNDVDLELPVHKNRTNFVHSDVLVPWTKTKSGTFHRFYHVFEEGELERLVLKATSNNDEVKIEKSYYDQGNWCVIFQKI